MKWLKGIGLALIPFHLHDYPIALTLGCYLLSCAVIFYTDRFALPARERRKLHASSRGTAARYGRTLRSVSNASATDRMRAVSGIDAQSVNVRQSDVLAVATRVLGPTTREHHGGDDGKRSGQGPHGCTLRSGR